ncbi:MAG: carbohydrate ABC transporter permease [Dictyoglomus sp.]|nr:carbohydrate ABC transporter permease [Dictyoglomus sp.]MCX7942584.1 carbohydrate ABC transporter permease [Dictyoglomaceae bacterium]MDW8188994.1 carbohydrate ABC transporter permease [Dictyoglomus sp.]
MRKIGILNKLVNKKTKQVILSVILWIIAGFWFIPIFWMLSTSFKSTYTAVAENPPRWIPKEATLENYNIVFAPASGISVSRGIVNSLIVASLATILGLIIATPAAYALSRLRFRGRNLIFWSYVGILAFPGVLFLVPQFFIIHTLGLIDSFSALILPGLGGTFGVFLLRQYMLGIPRELEDAAWIDGCSRLRFLLTIVLPFVRPALLTLGLMSFLASWNSFLWPLLVMNTPEKLTLPIALVRFAAGWADPFRGIGPLMAGAFISVAPTLIIFIIFHRYLMQGISISTGGK